MGAFADRSRFDWYRATVPAHPEMLLEAVLRSASGQLEVQEGKGRFNYRTSTTVSEAGERVATILHGGPNGHPNVEASGERAPWLADLLRSGGPHRVTRCDVAIDLYGPDVFASMRTLALGVATDKALRCREIADPLGRSSGDTIYLGSRSSSLFVRIYEKGKADRGVYADVASDLLDPWVRVELEVKPEKDMKGLAATMPPEAFWGCSDWTARLASEALGMSPEPIPFHPRRTASDERAWSFMAAQYRNLARRRCQMIYGGDRAAMLADLSALWFDEESAVAS